MRPTVVSRWILALVVPACLLLGLAGVYALLTGSSPVRLFVREPAELRLHFEQERAAAAAGNPGEYRVDADPRVGFTLRANSRIETVEAPCRTDELGLRVRAGPPAAADAKTIAIVGDSVAFGYGLTDEQCLAQQLEDRLASAGGDGGPRRIVCRTVAAPGWNWRNECAFLEDHLDRIAPSFVLIVPIGNDLSDTDGILETGQRCVTADVSSPDPLLMVNLGRQQQLLLAYWPQIQKGRLALDEADLGPSILNADLGGESSRRFDEMAAGLARTLAALARRGIRAAILQYEDDPFSRALARRMRHERSTARDVPWIPLLDRVTAAESLPTDAHPNPATVAGLATWIARDLLGELHWFPELAPGGRPAALAADQEKLAGRRAPHRTPGEIEALAASERERAREQLRAEIVPASGRGMRQIYGGLTPAHGVGPRLLAALPRSKGIGRIELAPLPGRPDVGPIELVIEVDGSPAARATLRSDAPTVVEVPIDAAPLRLADGALSAEADLKLTASSWVSVAEFGGFELECARLTRIALVER